jgi:hypothetical protein
MPATSFSACFASAAAAFMSMCRKAGHSTFCMLGVFGAEAVGYDFGVTTST